MLGQLLATVLYINLHSKTTNGAREYVPCSWGVYGGTITGLGMVKNMNNYASLYVKTSLDEYSLTLPMFALGGIDYQFSLNEFWNGPTGVTTPSPASSFNLSPARSCECFNQTLNIDYIVIGVFY